MTARESIAPLGASEGGLVGAGEAAAESFGGEQPQLEISASLTPDQIARFHSEGFLAIPGVIDLRELAELVPVFDRLFSERAGYSEGNLFDFVGQDDKNPMLPQLLLPSRYEPALRTSKAYRLCVSMASQLLGGTAEYVFDHAMVKPPGGPPTPWHQDQAFWGAGMKHRTITFWIPLQDVDRENGCLRFIPNSNRGPLLDHRPLNDDPKKHGLEALNVADGSAVHCPLAMGGTTVHHWLTLHGAGANKTSVTRRAYALCLGVKGSIPLVTREYPWNRRQFTERDRRYRASLAPWARMKQEVRIRLKRLGLL